VNLLRKLYDWVIKWSETPYGPIALVILAFAESSFFPVPPDVLLIALAIGSPRKSLKFALYTVLASVFGAFLGYFIGYKFYELIGAKIIQFYGVQDQFNYVASKYHENAFISILIAGFTPIPYKVFTIAAGVFSIDLITLFTASLIGRSTRFFLVGLLIWKFGPSIKEFIDKKFNTMVIIFTILLIGGFLFIKYII
jgi:membrane protein YqaA with SNARE-associated domain